MSPYSSLLSVGLEEGSDVSLLQSVVSWPGRRRWCLPTPVCSQSAWKKAVMSPYSSLLSVGLEEGGDVSLLQSVVSRPGRRQWCLPTPVCSQSAWKKAVMSPYFAACCSRRRLARSRPCCAVTSRWHIVQRVRRLSTSHSPPPSATAVMWSTCQNWRTPHVIVTGFVGIASWTANW